MVACVYRPGLVWSLLIKGILSMWRPYLSLVMRNLIGLIVYSVLEA